MNDQRLEKAKTWLKAGQFADAGALYRQLWNETNNAYAASRYVHCLRKANHAEVAVKMGKRAMDQYPDDIWVRREVIWAHYDAYIKPNQKESNLNYLLSAAESLIALEPEQMPLRLTIFAVIDVAKQKGKWALVSEWCDKITPNQLSATVANDQRGKSDRERWYFAKIGSLIKVERWDEALTLAERAAQEYPNEINFPRWGALALAGKGQIEQAIVNLDAVVLKHRTEWYVLRDLADLNLQLERYEEALRCGCRAALADRGDKNQVNLYDLLGQIGLLLGKLELAASHVALSKAIRQREKWQIWPKLQHLEAEIHKALTSAGRSWPHDENDIHALARRCKQEWRNYVYAGLPRQTGIIKSMPAEKGHGWLHADNGEDVFFLKRDLPNQELKEGVRLDFALEASWDKSKNRSSMRAVDFRLIRNSD